MIALRQTPCLTVPGSPCYTETDFRAGHSFSEGLAHPQGRDLEADMGGHPLPAEIPLPFFTQASGEQPDKLTSEFGFQLYLGL